MLNFIYFHLLYQAVQLYGHLSPITKTIQVRRTRHAGHSWRSRHELIRDVLLRSPTHGRAKTGQPAQTYIQQLCEDTGCCPEYLPRAMNDREEWRKRVRDIRDTSGTWWWWWWWWYQAVLIIIFILLLWEFFTLTSGDGFPQESKGQKVSSNFRVSLYSGQSQ